MSIKYDVASAGHICIDITPKLAGKHSSRIEDVLIPGRLINLDGINFGPGGAVGNAGFAMSKLGLKVIPMATIGNDDFGDILSNIVKKQIGIDIKRSDLVSTSYSFILSIPNIDRIIMSDPIGNNAFCSNDIDFDLLKDTRLFHFGYPPLMKQMYIDEGRELISIFKQAKQTGVTTSLDMTLPDINNESGKVDWEKIVIFVLPYVDIFLPSVEEALFMLDRPEYERVKSLAKGDDFTKYIDMQKVCDLGDMILDLGCAFAIIKCGVNGIYFKSANRERLESMGRAKPNDIDAWAEKALFQETYVVDDFKSALAGGDTTIAGFLSALLRGYDVYDCLKIACKTGALCCTTFDSISGLSDIKDIYQKTINESTRNIFAPNNDRFSFDKQNLVWKIR